MKHTDPIYVLTFSYKSNSLLQRSLELTNIFNVVLYLVASTRKKNH